MLKTAAGIAGGLAGSPGAGAAPAAAPLPAVKFGGRDITRLVCGANPLYGYSHFNGLLNAHMKEWMTPERVLETLRACERNGINTWQVHYSAESMADLKKYRETGGKMNIFILSMAEMHKRPGVLEEVAALGPVGIAHHGNMTDDLFREGRMKEVQEFLKRVRDTGVMVGLSCHNPAVIEYVEEKNWDIDYYMACFYRISRTHDEIVKELGEAPLGEPFLEKDPVRMTAVVRRTSKPCLGFKILAAGRRTSRPQDVARAFDFAFANIKPSDAVIVGMYPRFKDEPRENAGHVRRIHEQVS
jgi:hypothetical protein